MPVTQSYHGFEHIGLETAIDQVPYSTRTLHLTLLTDGYLIASQPSTFLIVYTKGINQHIHIVVSSKSVTVILLHLFLQFGADVV